MDRVADGLYVGDAASAHQPELLSSCGITHVVSIGCAPDESPDFLARVTCLALPHVLDKPETFVLPALQLCVRFIDAALAPGEPRSNEVLVRAPNPNKVLVHCVYGQSRSITAVVAYLLTRGGPACSLAQILGHVRDLRKAAERPIAVNPGFLAQLHLLHSARGGFESAECKLLRHSLNAARTEQARMPVAACFPAEEAVTETGVRYCLYGLDSSRMQRALAAAVVDSSSSPPTATEACPHCGVQLYEKSSVLGSCGDAYVRRESDFVRAFVDDFWREYRSAARPRGGTAAADGADVRLSALGCGMARSASDPARLLCTSCGATVGAHAEQALSLCGGFLLADVFAVVGAAGGRKRRKEK